MDALIMAIMNVFLCFANIFLCLELKATEDLLDEIIAEKVKADISKEAENEQTN